ncbi:hypothetical protein LCGC14_1010100 [marine sediment metagenome]|uniref:3-methyladenine DNA glycosylase n=1 Tax=marine sediment metagenome TaxID=412755 RepID=A0A0F9QIR9_9ZZZZ
MSSDKLLVHQYEVLPQEFFARKTDAVARDLLGKLIVRKTKKGILSGKIVETEAYFGNGEDPASHAHRGSTPRSSIMFGDPGRAYVYFNYGVHWLLNFVAKKGDGAGAVLVRAVQPVEGIELMAKNRPTEASNVTNGPAKFTQAFGIDGSFNGLDVTTSNSELYVADFLTSQFKVVKSGRVGIKDGSEMQLRFYIKDNPFVSR